MMPRKRTKDAGQAKAPAVYEPTPAEAAMVRAYLNGKRQGVRAPRVKMDAKDKGTVQITPNHSDPTLWDAQLGRTFGTVDSALAEKLMNQLLNGTREGSAPVDSGTVNAALAAVHGIAPRDPAEAMLAVQMVAVHHFAMSCLRRAETADNTMRLEANGNMATKMLRTYTAQMEALKRYRSKGEQRVLVQHQHVNVTADKAAVQVNAGSSPALTAEGAGG